MNSSHLIKEFKTQYKEGQQISNIFERLRGHLSLLSKGEQNQVNSEVVNFIRDNIKQENPILTYVFRPKYSPYLYRPFTNTPTPKPVFQYTDTDRQGADWVFKQAEISTGVKNLVCSVNY
jgi:hypothetical protein